MPVGLILEVLVAILLIVTVGYCWQLDRRLKALRSGQDGLKAIIEGLDGATQRAQASIEALKSAADAAGGALSQQVAKGRALADELEIMIDAANALADRLEGARETAPRDRPRPAAAAPAAPAPRRSQRPTPAQVPDEWENALLKALREAR